MHFFAQPVVTLIGLGIAIDYGLFVVSRFREEIAEGYDTEAAVRRTVMTAGRTVVFSAVIIVASAAGLLLFPQGFLKSLTYARDRVGDAGGDPVDHRCCRPAWPSWASTSTRSVCEPLFRVPFLRELEAVSRAYLNWLADRLQKTKTREEVEKPASGASSSTAS